MKEDLTDVFVANGMLKPIDKFCNDYTSKQKTITESMIQEVKDYISRYPKPTAKIEYVSGNCIQAYKNRLKVTEQFNEGVSGTTVKTISGDVWQNVTVFETYKADELIDITLVFTGDTNRRVSKVPYPKGATRIEAVSYDGSKTLVFGQR
ncbi:hypothetical protein K4L44_03085 [Halosquirtibacter laminarini]|uniref:Uncharacterized protein n=1 Tax=Halosquirtibacter laminarini TaxID=3374600 RepID=A0AC61NR64_9BACT|nr:hypothetical protein K4L44_03085 [Prolixibacteraceae bacterium]